MMRDRSPSFHRQPHGVGKRYYAQISKGPIQLELRHRMNSGGGSVDRQTVLQECHSAIRENKLWRWMRLDTCSEHVGQVCLAEPALTSICIDCILVTKTSCQTRLQHLMKERMEIELNAILESN
jgi:hypothetical protein